MDDETKQRLAALVDRKRSIDDDAAHQKAEQERREQELSAKKTAALARWQESLKEIDSAISSINEMLASSGLSLGIEPSGRDVSPAIAQLTLKLSEQNVPAKSEKRLVINVNAYGKANPVFLIPHSGKNPDGFQIEGADQGFYEQLIVDYLDQAIRLSK